ncbi:MAG: hypothetical protein HY691_14400 [Chloroflexi bacterium]|nr:hypothetical protein [Chloroflexota bacterium]
MAWPQEPNWGTVLALLIFGTSPLASAALFARMLKNATGAVPVEEEEHVTED